MLNKVIYWVSTLLVSVLFFFSASMALQATPEYLEGINAMGFPDYFPSFHGPLKLLAAIAILIPRRFVLKHWAYAGMIFTLIFAIVAHQAVGDPFIIQIIGIVLTLVSYYFYLTRMSFPSLPFMKMVPASN